MHAQVFALSAHRGRTRGRLAAAVPIFAFPVLECCFAVRATAASGAPIHISDPRASVGSQLRWMQRLQQALNGSQRPDVVLCSVDFVDFEVAVCGIVDRTILFFPSMSMGRSELLFSDGADRFSILLSPGNHNDRNLAQVWR